MTIVYCSNAGTTRTYAEKLADSLGCRAVALEKAGIGSSEPVVFLGWVLGGEVQGLKDALARFDLLTVGAVGMLGDEEELAALREKAALTVPLFFLPGNFHPDKVTGVLKVAMRFVCRSMKNEAKKSGDPALREQVRQIEAGIDTYNEAALQPIIEYLRESDAAQQPL